MNNFNKKTEKMKQKIRQLTCELENRHNSQQSNHFSLYFRVHHFKILKKIKIVKL